MGSVWVIAVIAVILGTIAANALNIYTGALSLLTLDVPIKRWISVIEWPGLVAFLAGLVVSIPFMNSSLYTGPIAVLLHGADIAYYVGIVVAGVLYYVLRMATSRSKASGAGTLDNV